MNGYLSEKDYHETVHPEHTLVQKQAAIIEPSTIVLSSLYCL